MRSPRALWLSLRAGPRAGAGAWPGCWHGGHRPHAEGGGCSELRAPSPSTPSVPPVHLTPSQPGPLQTLCRVPQPALPCPQQRAWGKGSTAGRCPARRDPGATQRPTSTGQGQGAGKARPVRSEPWAHVPLLGPGPLWLGGSATVGPGRGLVQDGPRAGRARAGLRGVWDSPDCSWPGLWSGLGDFSLGVGTHWQGHGLRLCSEQKPAGFFHQPLGRPPHQGPCWLWPGRGCPTGPGLECPCPPLPAASPLGQPCVQWGRGRRGRGPGWGGRPWGETGSGRVRSWAACAGRGAGWARPEPRVPPPSQAPLGELPAGPPPHSTTTCVPALQCVLQGGGGPQDRRAPSPHGGRWGVDGCTAA